MLTKQERQEKTEKKIEEIKEESKELSPRGHLTLEEREKITVFCANNYSIIKICGCQGFKSIKSDNLNRVFNCLVE